MVEGNKNAEEKIMPILFHETSQTFHLYNEHVS